MQNKVKKRKSLSSNLFVISSLIIPVLTIIVFYIVPNMNSFTMAFRNYKGEWTLENFQRLSRIFTTSNFDLALALKNTLITFVIGVLLYPFQVLTSYFIYKKIPFAGFYRIAFFLPGIVFAVAFNLVFKQLMAPNGFIAQWVGQAQGLDYVPELLADSRYANYVVLGELIWLSIPGSLVLWMGTFTRIPEELLESGRLDGTTWWTEFIKIIVPMVWPTVSLQVVFMLSGILGASGEVFLLTNGQYGTMTLSAWLYIQMYANSGSLDTSNALYYMSAVGLCMTVIAVTIAFTVRHYTDKAYNDVDF